MKLGKGVNMILYIFIYIQICIATSFFAKFRHLWLISAAPLNVNEVKMLLNTHPKGSATRVESNSCLENR